MKNILILENDVSYSQNLKKEIENIFNYKVDVISSIEEMKNIDINRDKYSIIISDINFDNNQKAYLNKLSSYNIPIILITAFQDDLIKEETLKIKNIIDFIFKNDSSKFEQIIDKIKILSYLEKIKILIVDDSKTSQFINLRAIKSLYPTSTQIVANDGTEGLEKIKENDEIKLIITDYEMPKMDGITFTKKIRSQYSFDEKVIIAISGNTERKISSRFLKAGANDFLNKPFNQEELKCRIDNNIRIVMLLDEIKNMAYRDELTKLYNRRYFYEIATKTFASRKRKYFDVSVIMLDIDHFKRLNDTYGHQTGDLALKKFAALIKNNLRESDILARYGGEEFIILTIGCDTKKAFLIAESKIRKAIEKLSFIDNNGEKIHFTVSAGVSSKGDTLDEMIKNADKMLYKAKEVRNKVEAEFLSDN